jgi:glycosyltransferase involved in cell wall biosynthesis
MEAFMKKIAVVILTKNEEKNIVAVIENVRKITDEIIIIDSGSDDATVGLANLHGARVLYRKLDNDFSAQRNFVLDKTDADYILYIDADERLSFELIESVKNAVDKCEAKQYSFMRKIEAFDFGYNHGIFAPDEVIRLFPRLEVKWEHKVHERPVCKLPKQKLSGILMHYTYDSWQQWLDKAGQYTSIWAEDNFSKGKRVGKSAAFTHGIYGFIRAYFLQLGFLDGWAGLYSSLQHFFYTLLKYWKLYELQQKNK